MPPFDEPTSPQSEPNSPEIINVELKKSQRSRSEDLCLDPNWHTKNETYRRRKNSESPEARSMVMFFEELSTSAPEESKCDNEENENNPLFTTNSI